MKRIIIIIFVFFVAQELTAQSLSNKQEKEVVLMNDSIILDTLSIVPGSVSVSFKGKKLPENLYKIDYSNALFLINKQEVENSKYYIDTLTFNYRTFPISFSQKYVHKDSNIVSDNIKRKENKRYSPIDNTDNFFSNSQLNKSGSISRGITFGNNQDASVNSDFNLQLSGNISPEISVTANISDNNIPVQADGTSQHLREFDKVFIELKSKKSRLTVGDFDINKPEGYFMNLHKKVKGAGFMTCYNLNKNINVTSAVNAAVSKGKFKRQKITGQEGNQGPYKLSGANNELYVIILSGSEKIFINGELLVRGNENDYTIDYNAGELTFTAKRTITKDSRIIAEFEYSNLSYARFALSSENVIKTKTSEFYINLFSEHDAKNQNITQELSDEQKILLNSVGDDIHKAVVENSVLLESFNSDEVLYRKTDTIVDLLLFESVYVYTNDSTVNVYRLGFSYAGENSGNYIRIQNGINGRVYQWVAPENGIKQGNYEPLKLLISPKKKQMMNFGGKTELKNNTNLFYEAAFTNNDLNLFSDKDNEDNLGYALKLGIEKNLLKKDTSKTYLNFGSEYMFTDKHFDALEPYKNTEFERDWNLIQTNAIFNEQSFNLHMYFFKKNFGKIGIGTDILKRDNDYFGNKSNFIMSLNKKNYSADIHFNYLKTNDTVSVSEFIRYNAKIERKLPFLIIGIADSGEKNILNIKENDSISSGSFRFNQWETFVKTPDSKKRSFKVSYINREDFLPIGENLNFVSNSHNFNISGKLINTKSHKLNTDLTYRQLHIADTSLTDDISENTTAARLRHSINVFKGSISTTSFIEHVTGNELVREFSYIEVQAGQGIFAWKDFNENNIKELNEFVKANFQDEANYIRVSLPGNEYRKVYSQNFYQVLNLIPRRIWFKEKGFKKVISMFSNRFSYKLNRKLNHSADYVKIEFPDTVLLSLNSILKNNIGFEISKTHTKLNYTVISNKSRILTVNGIDTRTNYFHHINLNQNLNQFIFSDFFKKGNKTYSSEFFTYSNYNIEYYENKASLIFKADKKNDITTNFIFKKKTNLTGEEFLISYNAGAEYRFISLNQGSFTAKFDFIDIEFEGAANTSISYEMLEGLQSGKNYVWSVLWHKQLSEYLQLELNYSGRKSENNKIIHTGGLSIRAIF
ncbi:MAG: hypothetical protein K8R54_17790 [Bacteroidales bacterium]|nr:hypothetical protein [Bacteroidales bacterium]